jgi:hypothetical protein
MHHSKRGLVTIFITIGILLLISILLFNEKYMNSENNQIEVY